METYDAKQELVSKEYILIEQLENYGARKHPNQKDKYSCIHCSSSDGLGIFKDDKGNYRYKCFSCGETGNVIDILIKKDNVSFYNALKTLCDQYNIEYDNNVVNLVTGINKEHAVNYYKSEIKEAMAAGDQVTALRALNKADEIESSSNFTIFPYVDEKGNPLRVWDNVKVVLDRAKIVPTYNVITKEIEILGCNSKGYNNQIMDAHSLCHKSGLKLSLDFVGKSVNRIASENEYNPVADYLEECKNNYDGKGNYIDALCDTLTTPEHYSDELKKILILKWLLNTANIAFNDGQTNVEGCLILQGKQKDGKTTWIRRLIPPEFLKTGLELNPSNLDSIRKCIKYWVCELGELDATMKAEQAKLKAFLTEPVDEYRIPFGISPEAHNRTTSFYGTVNKFNFLKDETGDRRYWVIQVSKIDWEGINNIDRDQLWGEVMTLLPYYKDDLALTDEESEMLDKSNEAFRVKGSTQIEVETAFGWGSPEDTWIFMPSADIAKKLGLKTDAGMKEALEKCGAKYTTKRVGGKLKRGYIVPPFMSADF